MEECDIKFVIIDLSSESGNVNWVFFNGLVLDI